MDRFNERAESGNPGVLISVVVPVFGCRKALAELITRLQDSLDTLSENYEIILVEDGCPSNSWAEVERLTRKAPCLKGIKLSRNFGQHEAITAGLAHACGEWIVVMDCDLQDRPEEIIQLYQKAQEGFDIVFAKRHDRQDSFLRTLGSRCFYALLGYCSGTRLDPSIANFGIYHRRVIKAVLQMRESFRYFPLMVRWVGFKSTGITVEHCHRSSGKSAYSLRKLIHLSLGVMVSFSDKPLYLIVKLGCAISLISAISAFVIFVKAFLGLYNSEGWASVMVSIWFVGGVLMAMIGVVGIYVGNSFNEAKRRPCYIIDSTINIDQ